MANNEDLEFIRDNRIVNFADDLGENGIGILDIMVNSGLCSSKSEARTLVVQGGVSVNDEKITVPATFYTKEQLEAGLLVQKGKKNFYKVTVE